MESRVPHHIPGVSSSIMVQPLLDSRVPYGRLQHPLTIYPIDQMKSSHVENDYIDSPAAIVCQQPHMQPKHLAASRPTDAHPQPHQHHHHHHHHHHHPHTQDSTHPWISFSGRPSSISSSSSTSSDQRLLDHAAPTPVLDSATTTTTTTTASSISTSTSSSSSSSSSSLPAAAVTVANASTLGRVPGSGGGGGFQAKLPGGAKPGADLKPGGPGALLPAEAKHLLLCERCAKCRCTECTLPRALPSCWVCGQACLCSAQSLVDAATCMCLVKGVFYHCAEDEDDAGEGACADRPCSCAPAHRCARWSFMAALSVALPCLLCYLPAVGCAKLSQRCYDGARRPGCRCKVPALAKAGVAGILGKNGGSALDKQAS
ncbi:protein sprouty homolog 4 [Sardina pilchardus]|uniref:protein sprouty homolog 4 n=1 Tax=Sardina pilchardus TaxID=27697 RepID=UPI002E13B966